MQGDSVYIMMCVILGVLAVIAGWLLPDKIFLQKTKKYKERNPESYIKKSRKALFWLGIYYIFIGVLLIFIAKDPVLYLLYNIAMPFLPFIPLVFMIKRYT